MVTHSTILVWEEMENLGQIFQKMEKWTKEPGGLQSMQSQELDTTQ